MQAEVKNNKPKIIIDVPASGSRVTKAAIMKILRIYSSGHYNEEINGLCDKDEQFKEDYLIYKRPGKQWIPKELAQKFILHIRGNNHEVRFVWDTKGSTSKGEKQRAVN